MKRMKKHSNIQVKKERNSKYSDMTNLIDKKQNSLIKSDNLFLNKVLIKMEFDFQIQPLFQLDS